MSKTGITCPNCKTEDIEFDVRADYIADNRFIEVDDQGNIAFEGRAEIFWEASDNERLACHICGATFPITDDVADRIYYV